MNQLPAIRESSGVSTMPAEMTIEELVTRTRKVQEAMRAVMHDGEHYGVVPGTGSKPTLLKPGAEKLLNLFMMAPEYLTVKTREGDHLEIESTCRLSHIPTGLFLGSGQGSCSTRESKYAYRQGKRACPKCGAEAINRSKYPPKGKPNEQPGWYCFARVGGCGAEFSVDDQAIVGQSTGRVDNPDKADQYNTVLKMANKRSLVAAVLNVTGASDIFTQDLEDLEPPEPKRERPAAVATPAPTSDAGAASREGDADTTEQPEDAAELVAKIKARWEHLKVGEGLRKRQWAAHAGNVPFGEVSPDLDVAMLSTLLGLLGAK